MCGACRGSALRFIVVIATIAVFASHSDNMKTFDDIEVRRPELAKGYLALIKAQPSRPLAMFAPRRVR